MSRPTQRRFAEMFRRAHAVPFLMAMQVALFGGCSGRPQSIETSSRCLLRVATPEGVPLPSVVVEVDGQVKTTSTEGEVELTLTGRAGEVRQVKVRCPDDYASPPPTSLTVQKRTQGQPMFRYDASCTPLRHSVVLVVRAVHGPHLPVYRLGRQIAITNDEGIAHALLSVPAGESLRVTLDARGARHVEPDAVTFDFPSVARDELWAVEHRFKPISSRSRPRAPRPAAPARPKRL